MAPKTESPAKFDSEEEGAPLAGSEAAFDSRVIALIIDAFAAGIIYAVISTLSGTLALLLYTAYFLTRDALPFLDGQSLGKKLIKIRAVDLQGKSLSGNWQASIVRNIPFAIPFFGLVEAYILYKKKEDGLPLRRLGDEWGKTKVIVAKQEPAL